MFVGSLTVPAHNIWADAAIAYQKANYPAMTLVTHQAPCRKIATPLGRRPSKCQRTPRPEGRLAFGSQGAPGAAPGVREADLPARSPSSYHQPEGNRSVPQRRIRKPLGIVAPGRSGYAMVYLSKLILDGKRDTIKQGSTSRLLASRRSKA